MLAIHLNRELYDQGFKPNKQTHCVPMLTSAIKVCIFVGGWYVHVGVYVHVGLYECAFCGETRVVFFEQVKLWFSLV